MDSRRKRGFAAAPGEIRGVPMKTVRTLLLGSAAGLLAVAGAQAADMPVKAKPVEYVKICTLYGAGFYYIPGTDTCIKIGGYVRVQVDNARRRRRHRRRQPADGGQGRFTRDLTNDINYRVRGVVSFDARTQTEYGTLRSYIRAGWENTTPAATGGGTTATPFWDRAFIQFAGFTVGRAQSFFDMFTYGGAYTYLNVRTAGDTGASGQNLWAYTVQFGNGVSYSLSLEDPATRKGGRDRHHLRQLLRRRRAAARQRPDRSTARPARQPASSASGFRTSSPTCASTRPGAMRASAPRSTTPAAPTTARRTTSTTDIRPTSTAGRSRPAAC